jgi:hypothetical protein
MHEKPGNSRGSLGPQEFAPYKNAWHLMEQQAQTVPWQLQPWVSETLEVINWPHRPV